MKALSYYADSWRRYTDFRDGRQGLLIGGLF
jgi:hypothetical protein